MARGHPDFQTQAGRSVGGALVNTLSFSGVIAAGITGQIDLGVVPVKSRHSFLQITISCEDDTAIHKVTLTRLSDGWTFFMGRFIMGENFRLDSDDLNAGEEASLSITNNSAGALTFEGVVSWVVREL